MKNQDNPTQMQDVISPIFLLVYPGTIVFSFPNVFQSLIEHKTNNNKDELRLGYVSLFGMIFRLLLYTTWLGQYAANNHHPALSWTFFSIFIIIVILSLYIFYKKVYSKEVRNETSSNKELFLNPKAFE